MLGIRGKAYIAKHILFYCLLLVVITVRAQPKQNADDLYKLARQKAFDEKRYTEAINYAKQALEINPDYTEIVVFTGRVYAWDKQPDSARRYFQLALSQNANMEDAYIAYSDLEFWQGNNDSSLAIVNLGLQQNSNSKELMLRKARLLNAKREYRAANLVLDTLLSLDKDNTEARALAVQVRDNVSGNRIGIKYDYITFDKQFSQPWHFISVDYTRQTKIGAIAARINYANRFGTSGYQYEVEAYPKFSKIFYAYVNLGYSDNTVVFPHWKGGLSLYANLPKAFEAEAGLRYLYFTSDVFIYTLYAGKYYKSFLFGARTYLTPNEVNIAQSYSALIRYYFGGADDYVGLNLGAGISPDDRRTNIQLNSNYKLKSYSAELAGRYSIRKLNVILLNVSILNQEYLPGTIGNQYQVGVGYIRRF